MNWSQMMFAGPLLATCAQAALPFLRKVLGRGKHLPCLLLP